MNTFLLCWTIDSDHFQWARNQNRSGDQFNKDIALWDNHLFPSESLDGCLACKGGRCNFCLWWSPEIFSSPCFCDNCKFAVIGTFCKSPPDFWGGLLCCGRELFLSKLCSLPIACQWEFSSLAAMSRLLLVTGTNKLLTFLSRGPNLLPMECCMVVILSVVADFLTSFCDVVLVLPPAADILAVAELVDMFLWKFVAPLAKSKGELAVSHLTDSSIGWSASFSDFALPIKVFAGLGRCGMTTGIFLILLSFRTDRSCRSDVFCRSWEAPFLGEFCIKTGRGLFRGFDLCDTAACLERLLSLCWLADVTWPAEDLCFLIDVTFWQFLPCLSNCNLTGEFLSWPIKVSSWPIVSESRIFSVAGCSCSEGSTGDPALAYRWMKLERIYLLPNLFHRSVW